MHKLHYHKTAYTLLMLFSIAQNNQSKLVLSPFRSFLSEKKGSILYLQHRTFFHLDNMLFSTYCATRDQ